MNRKWIIAAGVAAGLVIFGFLGLRFGAQLAAPFLPDVVQPLDTQAAAGRRGDTTLQAGADTGAAITRSAPLVVDGSSYTVQVLHDTAGEKPPEAARRVTVFNQSGRAIYEENLFLRLDSTSSTDWMSFTPLVLEDDAGRSRGFQFIYAWHPSAPSSGVAFNIAAPRGDSLAILTPTIVGFFGALEDLPAGAIPGSRRLHPGNQLILRSGRGWFEAMIPLRVDFECSPRSDRCVRIDLRDSVRGLARFAVQPVARQPLDTAVSVELFAEPRGGSIGRVAIAPGQEPELLGGAGRVFFERTPNLYLSAEDEWLEIRVNGRRGWITGQEAFQAIGLRQPG